MGRVLFFVGVLFLGLLTGCGNVPHNGRNNTRFEDVLSRAAMKGAMEGQCRAHCRGNPQCYERCHHPPPNGHRPPPPPDQR